MTHVEFLPRAREDLRSARQYYAEENPEAARRFMEEVVRGTRLIREAPLRWPRVGSNQRRWVLRRFEYSLVYRYAPETDTVFIVAVSHHHRDPTHWSSR